MRRRQFNDCRIYSSKKHSWSKSSQRGEANPEGASSFVTNFYIARSSSLTEAIAQGTHERRVVWPVNRSWSDFTKWHQLVYLFFSPTTSPNYHRPDIGDVLGLGIMGLLYVCVGEFRAFVWQKNEP